MALAGLVFSIPAITQFMFTEIKVKYLCLELYTQTVKIAFVSKEMIVRFAFKFGWSQMSKMTNHTMAKD